MKGQEIIAVSGGPDSVFLLLKHMLRVDKNLILAHMNHGARGRASDADQTFVEELGRTLRLPVKVRKSRIRIDRISGKGNKRSDQTIPGFEEKARKVRYDFLRGLMKECRANGILLAHTADDQVETVLMRIIEGAGISGLKGIPRRTDDGIERPLLDTWREEILHYLDKRKIPYRVDKSNFDTRFERNWVRHVLIPLLEKRYGKSVKKRIFALGERFREIDEFLETTARRWMRRNVRSDVKGGEALLSAPVAVRAGLSRKPYAKLPGAVRKKVIQLICFERLGIAPNERLLESMDRLVVSGGPSSRLNIGKRSTLRCRYDQVMFEMSNKMTPASTGAGGKSKGIRNKIKERVLVLMDGPGLYEVEGRDATRKGLEIVPSVVFAWEEKGKTSQGTLKRLAQGERAAAFDADALSAPLTIRPLRQGDRIRPFGMDDGKKVKEILIDRKVPRDERWGRPVVCDAKGTILWIPGVVRSSHAPVNPKTRRPIILRILTHGENPA